MRSIMAMLRPRGNDAASLYAALVAEARQPGWYLDCGAEDSMTGRFAVLASLVALATIRLESGGEESVRASAALTEAFIADMDPQLRQAGFGDPTLGKEVRRLVGALANRVGQWRRAIAGDADWAATARSSVLMDRPAGEAAETYASERLRRFHETLQSRSDPDVIAGRIG